MLSKCCQFLLRGSILGGVCISSFAFFACGGRSHQVFCHIWAPFQYCSVLHLRRSGSILGGVCGTPECRGSQLTPTCVHPSPRPTPSGYAAVTLVKCVKYCWQNVHHTSVKCTPQCEMLYVKCTPQSTITNTTQHHTVYTKSCHTLMLHGKCCVQNVQYSEKCSEVKSLLYKQRTNKELAYTPAI